MECHGGVMFRIFMILATNLVSIARRICSKERNKIIGLSTDLRLDREVIKEDVVPGSLNFVTN